METDATQLVHKNAHGLVPLHLVKTQLASINAEMVIVKRRNVRHVMTVT